MPIKFYYTKKPFGFFSNFSRYSIILDGREWPTTEHYFQAQKYINTPRYEDIANAPTPRIAADLGRVRSIPIRPDWEEIKNEIMKKCVLEKVNTYKEIKNALISTGDQEIIEDSPIDYYWGCGKDGTGKNMLGKILMEIRKELKEEIDSFLYNK